MERRDAEVCLGKCKGKKPCKGKVKLSSLNKDWPGDLTIKISFNHQTVLGDIVIPIPQIRKLSFRELRDSLKGTDHVKVEIIEFSSHE